jgi:hypothetical protein
MIGFHFRGHKGEEHCHSVAVKESETIARCERLHWLVREIMQLEEAIEAVGGLQPAAGIGFLPLSGPDLAQVELACDGLLPESYKSFLLRYGAAAFRRPVLVNPTQLLPKHISKSGKDYLDVFYGKAIGDRKHLDLLHQIGTYRGRMPRTLLPIANNGGGNQFCIVVKGKEYGQIVYWDHNHEFDEEDYLEDLGIDLDDLDEADLPPIPPEAWFQNVYPVAAAFDDLFSRLEVDTND